MDNTARTRQRVLAVFLRVTAVLYISGEAFSPKGTDQVITTTATALKVLPSRPDTRLNSTSRARWSFSGSAAWPSRMRDRRAGQEPRPDITAGAPLRFLESVKGHD